MKTERWLVLGVMLVILGTGAWICYGPEERIAYLLSDDAYYYLSAARNMAAGNGSTVDGIHPTNGYHPLWCWLLVPLFLATGEPGLAVRMAGLLWFAAAAGSVAALWWALRSRKGGGGALMAAAFFGLHPFVGLIPSRANGLETPLFALLLAASAGCLARACRNDGRGYIAVGIAIGATALARFDGLILAAIAGAFLWYRSVRGQERNGRLREAVAISLLMSALVAPSLAWNTLRFGNPMPISGRVIHLYDRISNAGLSTEEAAAAHTRQLTESVPLLLAGQAVMGTGATESIESGGIVLGSILLAAAAALAAWAWKIRCRAGRWEEDAYCWLALFAASHYLVNAGWFWSGSESLFRLYYFMPEAMLIAAAAGTVLAFLARRLPRHPISRHALRNAVVIGMTAYFITGVYSNLDREDLIRAGAGPVGDKEIFGWIRSRLPEDAVLASHSSGILNYYCGRPVVNLDGLVNDLELYRAIREDDVAGYVAGQPIRYLVGHRKAFESYRRFLEGEPAPAHDLGSVLARLELSGRVTAVEVSGVPENWRIFELSRRETPSILIDTARNRP